MSRPKKEKISVEVVNDVDVELLPEYIYSQDKPIEILEPLKIYLKIENKSIQYYKKVINYLECISFQDSLIIDNITFVDDSSPILIKLKKLSSNELKELKKIILNCYFIDSVE